VRDRGVTVDLKNPGNGHVHHRSNVIPELADEFRLNEDRRRCFEVMVWRQVLMFLGGPLAELRYLNGRWPSAVLSGDSVDLTMARRYLACVGADNDVGWALAHGDVRKLLRRSQVWPAVRTLAETLASWGHVSNDEVETICRRVPRITMRAWIMAPTLEG
jgi:hypothetical protein